MKKEKMKKPIESINPPKKPSTKDLEKKAEEATKIGKKHKIDNKASGEDISKLEEDEGVEQKGGRGEFFPPGTNPPKPPVLPIDPNPPPIRKPPVWEPPIGLKPPIIGNPGSPKEPVQPAPPSDPPAEPPGDSPSEPPLDKNPDKSRPEDEDEEGG